MPQSTRHILFHKLLEDSPAYLQHYISLDEKYIDKNEIHFEYLREMKSNIRRFAEDDRHYKYKIYLNMNTTLEPSNFIHDFRHISSKITKFRVGSHYLPIETGRWCRKPRNERLCPSCKVLGDEVHLIYSCREIDRTGLTLPNTFTDLWKCDVFKLFLRIESSCDYL